VEYGQSEPSLAWKIGTTTLIICSIDVRVLLSQASSMHRDSSTPTKAAATGVRASK
jgi:hypothetical protein